MATNAATHRFIADLNKVLNMHGVEAKASDDYDGNENFVGTRLILTSADAEIYIDDASELVELLQAAK